MKYEDPRLGTIERFVPSDISDDLYDVLCALAVEWDNLSDDQQLTIAEAIANSESVDEDILDAEAEALVESGRREYHEAWWEYVSEFN